jgi:hypothetical protein
MADAITFNGIDGTTGEYLTPPMTEAELGALARGRPVDPELAEELAAKAAKEESFGVEGGFDPDKLDEVGWGIVLPAVIAGDAAAEQRRDAILEALEPLLTVRRAQAGERFKILEYRPGEPREKFLARHGQGPGPIDPLAVPYYQLIVADPVTIPFSFQYSLDVPAAVGRAHFPSLAELAHYAAAVAAHEKDPTTWKRARRIDFLAPANPGDRATTRSATELAPPLAAALKKQADWTTELVPPDQSTHAGFAARLGGASTPGILFTASHGVGFPAGHADQRALQGALITQDWGGPGKGAPARGHLFAGEDIGPDVAGLICFSFACFGAGTPQLDEFPHLANVRPAEIAAKPFVARLPQRLLAHPKGPALAFVGHVERAWSYGFAFEGTPQLGAFRAALRGIARGTRIGLALEDFGQRFADLSTLLTRDIEEKKFGQGKSDAEIGQLWTANNDARSYVLIGDPAVRLPT